MDVEYRYLSGISSPRDVKNLSEEQLTVLAGEIRDKLIKTVSENGGHLASNLGVVELTVALHRVFDSPNDKILWDVGHQCYTHKLLTGRFDDFETLRKPGGISGFTNRFESRHDIMSGGHSSVALSAAYGIAVANRLSGKKEYTVAVVGDGAFTGGEVYEGLNNAGRSGKGTRLIVILNDNEMSISKNVGALARYLAVIRSNPRYYRLKAKTESVLNAIPLIGTPMAKELFKLKTAVKNHLYDSTMFEDLGFRYIGPINGHDIPRLTEALKAAVEADYPVVLHVNTVKGKGYSFAESAPDAFHGVGAFDMVSGEPNFTQTSFSEQFGKYMIGVAKKDERVCCITAAMALGTGLKAFSEQFPERFFDVGIAEPHAATFASGLARGGMLPVFAVYSTFLQRSYDQLIHDCAMQDLKIVFAVDRAGFAGSDGQSHHGIFDTAFLNSVPKLSVFAPSCFYELTADLETALYHIKGSVAVRYPRGIEPAADPEFKPTGNVWDLIGDETAEAVIVTYGILFFEAMKAKRLLEGQGIKASVCKLNQIKPIPKEAVEAVKAFQSIYFFEEAQRFGGIGETFADRLFELGYRNNYCLTAIPGEFPGQNSRNGLLKQYGLDAQSMYQKISKTGNEHE